jgi:hypothetical protein
MAEDKKRAAKAAKAKSRDKAGALRASPLSARAPTEDRSFVQLLASRSPDKIAPEATLRLEGGRRLYVAETEKATAAELAALEDERKRIQDQDPNAAKKRARLDRLIAAVKLDSAGNAEIRKEIERAVTPERGGWTIAGRVLTRDGKVPAKAEVVFLDAEGKEIKALGALPVGKDGTIRESFAKDVVQKLGERAKVTAAVRVGRQIVATEERSVRVAGDRIHQFDLRLAAT